MFGYIYKITNNINNKIYIGQHQYPFEYLDDTYEGGGKLLHLAYEKYGKENFSTVLVECCDTEEELDCREKYWIAKLNAQDKSIGYNISPGGTGGSGEMQGNTKELLRQHNLDTTVINNGTKCIKIKKSEVDGYLKDGWVYGYLPYNRSKAFKENMSKKLTGYIGMHKGNIKTKVPQEEVNMYVSLGYEIGWGTSKEKTKLHYIKGEKSKYMINTTGEQLRVSESFWESFLDDGWVFGHNYSQRPHKCAKGYKISELGRKHMSESHIGNKQSEQAIQKQREKLLGRIVIHNENNERKLIHAEDLQTYLDCGWIKGSPLVPNKRSRTVVCFETGQKFQTIASATRYYPHAKSIKKCVKNMVTKFTSGGYHWYYENNTHHLLLLLNKQYNDLIKSGKTQDEAIKDIRAKKPESIIFSDEALISGENPVNA